MRRKFLAPALVFIMCIGITMTAYASPQADQLQNPANNIRNLDSVQQNLIRGYLTNGGKTNYRNMLNYILMW